jgi:MFS family permease
MQPHTEQPRPRAFEALRIPGFGIFVSTFMLTMMADNIEHVISYWVIFQKFRSPALGGFAVIAHWLPYLFLSVAVGALNDRFDSRRLIQAGAALFALVSLGWGYFFVSGTLTMWHAMVLLVLHGCAGVLWMTSSQMLLYDIVGPGSLASAVRLNATARYVGVLVGPGIGSLIMRTIGPTHGIFLNALFYVPLLVWLVRAPYGRVYRGDAPGPKRAVRGIADIVDTLRDVRGIPVLLTMVILAGAASFFVGNSYQAQMPVFATDLGHGDPGAAYTMLLAADAAGACSVSSAWRPRGSARSAASRSGSSGGSRPCTRRCSSPRRSSWRPRCCSSRASAPSDPRRPWRPRVACRAAAPAGAPRGTGST